MEFELDAKNFHFAEAMYRSGSEPPLVDIRLFDGKKRERWQATVLPTLGTFSLFFGIKDNIPCLAATCDD